MDTKGKELFNNLVTNIMNKIKETQDLAASTAIRYTETDDPIHKARYKEYQERINGMKEVQKMLHADGAMWHRLDLPK